MASPKTAPPPAAIPTTVPNYTNSQIIEAATGRWGTVADGIKFSEPYVIQVPGGDDIVIPPLTRRRRKKLKTAQAAYLISAAQMAQVSSEGEVEQSTLSRIEQITEDAEKVYDEALFGTPELRDRIYAFFDEQQEEFWDAFYQDVHNRLVNRVDDLPTDGEDTAGKDDSSST